MPSALKREDARRAVGRGTTKKETALKKIRILTTILCIVAVLLSLSGCAKEDEAANARLEAQTRGMIDALLADDAATAYGFVRTAIGEADFPPVYAQMREMLAGVTDYTLTRLEHNATDASYALSFLLAAEVAGEEVTYAITAQEAVGGTGLNAFHLQKNAVVVGTLTTMGEATALHWGALLLGLIAWVVTVIAAVDCWRHAKDSRGMALMLILLGMVSLSFTVTPEFAFSVTHGYYFPYTAYVTASTGESVFRLFLPLGAIGYFLLRRRFLHPEEK